VVVAEWLTWITLDWQVVLQLLPMALMQGDGTMPDDDGGGGGGGGGGQFASEGGDVYPTGGESAGTAASLEKIQ